MKVQFIIHEVKIKNEQSLMLFLARNMFLEILLMMRFDNKL